MSNDHARRGVIRMMFRYAALAVWVLVFASLMLVGLPNRAAAHHPKPTAAAEKDSFSFAGTVASVDYAANVVELTTDGRHVTLVLEPTTSIDIAGQPGSVSDIRPGVKLHAEGVVRDGTFIAQTITIRGNAKPKH
ncbi:MAG TPA: hypothetical protein VID19_07150 [Candidatus Eremiobacteraceae bacterium]|jgi:hypothetical protein